MANVIEICDLYPKQIEIIQDIVYSNPKNTKFYIIRAGRQTGKSFQLRRLAVYLAGNKKKIKIAWINAYDKQNKESFTEISNWVREFSSHINGTSKHIILKNLSEIQFFTAKSYDSVRGFSPDYLICDEFSFWPVNSWQAIAPIVTGKPQSKIIIASTPLGKNEFWNLCEKSKTSPYYKEYRLSYLDNPFADLRFIEEMRNSWSDMAFKQEFLGEFVFGKGAVFNDFSKYQNITEWEDPIPGKRYYFAIDIAGDGEDKTVLYIIDDLGNTVYIHVLDDGSLPNQASILAEIINRYQAEGIGESTGLGLGLVQILQEMGIKIYREDSNNVNKQQRVVNFLKDLNSGFVKLPSIFLCPALDSEMTVYQARRLPSGKLQYGHPDGLHDDYVDAMLMVYAFKNKQLFGGGTIITSDDLLFDNRNTSKFVEPPRPSENIYIF